MKTNHLDAATARETAPPPWEDWLDEESHARSQAKAMPARQDRAHYVAAGRVAHDQSGVPGYDSVRRMGINE